MFESWRGLDFEHSRGHLGGDSDELTGAVGSRDLSAALHLRRALTMMAKLASAYDLVEPNAAALIESLRAFGYTPEAAVADLVDNSITAGAKNVWITLDWSGRDSRVLVVDDGRGMDRSHLVAAMRPGSQSPLEARAPNDLGRFGLGLKTASFSQCRSLTVASHRQGGAVATRRWDLDYVGETSEWRLLHGFGPGSEICLTQLDRVKSGTVVVWEKLDRLVGDADSDDRKAHTVFLDRIRVLEDHLRMVFHRFLSRRSSSLTIWLNGQKLAAWDPFMSEHPATQRLPVEELKIAGQSVSVTPFVLPHHSKLSPSAHSDASGPAGWNAQQGFYVYRNNRLLVPGDWLGLSLKKEEHYKLARIAVDIPNSLDHEWDIDVRKARARPPPLLLDDFRRIARLTRERAADVYRYRGKIVARKTSQDFVFVWAQVTNRGKTHYRVNRKHPLVVEAVGIPDPYGAIVRALLRLLEETVPVPLITIEGAENPDRLAGPFEGASTTEVRDVLSLIYDALLSQGISRASVRERLLALDGFSQFDALVIQICEEKGG